MESFIVICTAINLLTATQSISALRIQQQPPGPNSSARPPRIIEQPQDLIVPKNEPATIRCRADGEPTPQVFWYKEPGELVASTATGNSDGIFGEQLRLVQNGGDLFFSRVIHGKKDKSDTGIYYCIARNPFGEARSRNATLQVAFIRDEFRKEPNITLYGKLGEKVILPCQPPRGFPAPRVSWKHNGRDLLLTTRHNIIDEGSLLLADLRQSDGGEYKCVAENLAGFRESPPATIEVMTPPSFTEYPHDVTALEGDNVLFECRVAGSPPPSVTWKKDLDRNIGRDNRIRQQTDGSLRIEGVIPIDEGAYTCVAENDAGSIRATVTLTVHVRPSFIWTPKDQRVTINGTVSFDCLATGNPPPAVFWTKEGSQGGQILMFPGQPHGRFSVQSDGRLLIDKAELSDTGSYVCSALSVAGSAIVKAYLEVSPPSRGPPPIIAIGPMNQTLALGSVAVLPCEATGHPAPTIRWLKDESVLSTLKNPRMTIQDSGTLQLSDLRAADSGIYRCLATSPTGETSWSAALIVESPSNPHVNFQRMSDLSSLPPAPSKPQIMNVSTDFIEIQWWPGIGNGKSGTVKMYRIEYFSSNSPGSWAMASISPINTRVTVKDLQPDTSYIFLVRSVNAHGVSPPSPVSDVVRTLAAPQRIPDFDWSMVRSMFAREYLEISIAEPVSSTAIKLSWNILGDERFIRQYNATAREIESASLNGTREERNAVFWKGAEESYVFYGLKKYAVYEFTISPVYKELFGRASRPMRARTAEDVPEEAPQGLKVNLVNMTAISVSWTTPPADRINGKLAGYRLFVIPSGQGDSSSANAEVRNISIDRTGETHELVGNLTSGVRYKVVVAARTEAGLGVFSRPVYVKMETPISTTGDLLREAWFIGTLGSIIFLFLVAFCALLYLRRRSMKKADSLPGYSFKQSGSMVIHEHTLYQNEQGIMLPNSIMGIGGYDDNERKPDWIGTTARDTMGRTTVRRGGPVANTINRKESYACPIHGMPSTEKQGIPPTAEIEELSSGMSTTSSRGRSYPETVSVPSQKSTPRSRRSSLARKLDLSGLEALNWSEIIPPPPNCPPPNATDKFSLSSYVDESDSYTPGMEYISRKYTGRNRFRQPVKVADHEARLIIQRQSEMARERRYLMAQMSLDRGRFTQRDNSREFVQQFVARNLQRARSCESSVACEEEAERSEVSSEYETAERSDVDQAETSPCLSSEASFFLDGDFMEAVKRITGARASDNGDREHHETVDHRDRERPRSPQKAKRERRRKTRDNNKGDFQMKQKNLDTHTIPNRPNAPRTTRLAGRDLKEKSSRMFGQMF